MKSVSLGFGKGEEFRHFMAKGRSEKSSNPKINTETNSDILTFWGQFTDVDRSVSQPRVSRHVHRADTEEKGKEDFFYDFALPELVYLPSRDSYSKVFVSRIHLKNLNLHHWGIPKLSSQVFYKGVTANPSEYPLLQGKMIVFFNEKISGYSEIPKVGLQ
jgi:hypothetical protein